ncbi:MAG TPA: hypothetical protein VMN39_03415, partial [Longimicrobiaceae bacterium]|nr:hypothetical protein [Longimicrobiaceae bacterium]
LEVEPLSARVVRSDGDAKGEEIGSAQFETLPKPVETVSEPLPLGAEVADLLRLRFLPETVNDQVLMRMMISRFAYEAAAPEPVFGGRFFHDVSERPPLGELERRLPEFRKWEEARATNLPDRLKVTLDLTQGTAPYESWGEDDSLRSMCFSVHRAVEAGESLTERQEAERRICRYLEAAWNTPDTILYLKRSFRAHVSEGESRGPRTACGGGNPYCRSIDGARKEVGLPSGEGVRDLIKLDRLPLLDREALAALDDERDLELELVLSPTSAEVAETWPETVFRAAKRRALAFGERYGVGVAVSQALELPGPTFLHQAKLLDARVVDAKTGEVVAEPELAVPATPPADRLSLDGEMPAEWNILGIHLGDSFEQAEAAIRAHMPVDRVLIADPSALTESLAGPPPPFSSGRMYVSEEQHEAIAIFDEPPAADDKVLGIWRLVKVPKGALDPASLAPALRERYGEPSAVEGSGDRAEFLWSRFRPDCGSISNTHQNDLWRDADGAPADPPGFAKSRHYYPDLWVSSYGLISEDGTRSKVGSLCPAVLGVQYQRWSAVPAAEDELVSWLHDQRAYAEAYYDSRDAESEATEAKPSAASAAPGVKF